MYVYSCTRSFTRVQYSIGIDLFILFYVQYNVRVRVPRRRRRRSAAAPRAFPNRPLYRSRVVVYVVHKRIHTRRASPLLRTKVLSYLRTFESTFESTVLSKVLSKVLSYNIKHLYV